MKLPQWGKILSLWIAAAVSTRSDRGGGRWWTPEHRIHILKGKLSKKKARLDVSMLNSQVRCPFCPWWQAALRRGIWPGTRSSPGEAHRPGEGRVAALHTRTLGNPSPKLGGAPGCCWVLGHSVLTWGWSWEPNTQHYFSESDGEVETADGDVMCVRF